MAFQVQTPETLSVSNGSYSTKTQENIPYTQEETAARPAVLRILLKEA